MKSVITLIAALATLVGNAAAAQTVAIVNARIQTMSSKGEIASGTVVLRDGKIMAVGETVQPPQDARVIDARGRTVTPGFMIGASTLGIRDLISYGSLDDSATASPFVSAGYDVTYSLNPDLPAITGARADGITRALATPSVGMRTNSSGIFGGQAAAIRLSDDADLVMRPKAAVTMRAGGGGAQIVGGGRGAQLVLLKAILAEARAFASQRSGYDVDRLAELDLTRIDLEALVPVVRRETPLIIEVDRVADIRAIIRLAREENIRVALLDAPEAWVAAKELAAANIPVIVDSEALLIGGYIEGHYGLDEMATTIFNATRLHAAGVTIAFRAGTSRPADWIRSPRINIGRLVGRAQLPYEAALAGLTTGPAKIAGVADRYGRVEPGMVADVVLWNGDPLAVDAYPEAVFIDGEEQPIKTRQEAIGERFLEQYRASGVIPPAGSQHAD